MKEPDLPRLPLYRYIAEISKKDRNGFTPFRDVLSEMQDKSKQLELFNKARQGDIDSLNDLIALARISLVDHARRTTLNDDLAEDAVQDTLLAVQSRFQELNNIEHFWGWLHTTLNYKILKQIPRAYRQQQTKSLADVEGDIKDHANGAGLEDLVTAELKDAVLDSVAKLSPWHRAVLSLRCYEDLSFPQIAKRLGWNAITARVKFYRAKQALARNLASNGFSKVLLPLALVLFGKLTASTRAAAATLTVPAAALNAGAAATAIGIATAKTTIVTVAAAAIITTTAVVINNNTIPANNPRPATETTTVAWFTPLVPNATLSEFYFPTRSDNYVEHRIRRCDEYGRPAHYVWFQNDAFNYRCDPDTKTAYLTNYHYFAPDLSVMQLPTDSYALRQFLATAQGTNIDFARVSNRLSARRAGLFVRAYATDTGMKLWGDYATLPNLDDENFFKLPDHMTNPTDQRDAMHKRGWTYFTIKGTVNNKNVTGCGRIPFVYAASREYTPWLTITIDGHTYTDADSQTLFKGLSRPWQGLHTIDTIRRDAAQQGLTFQTKLFSQDGLRDLSFPRKRRIRNVKVDKTTATVTVRDGDTTIKYTIKMKKDLLEKITFNGTTEGEITFNYLEDIEQSQTDFTTPTRNKLPNRQNTQGLKWLWKLTK